MQPCINRDQPLLPMGIHRFMLQQLRYQSTSACVLENDTEPLPTVVNPNHNVLGVNIKLCCSLADLGLSVQSSSVFSLSENSIAC